MQNQSNAKPKQKAKSNKLPDAKEKVTKKRSKRIINFNCEDMMC